MARPASGLRAEGTSHAPTPGPFGLRFPTGHLRGKVLEGSVCKQVARGTLKQWAAEAAPESKERLAGAPRLLHVPEPGTGLSVTLGGRNQEQWGPLGTPSPAALASWRRHCCNP